MALQELDRRTLLKGVGIGALGLASAGLLAACTPGGSARKATGTLSYNMMGNANMSDIALISAAVNKRLKERGNDLKVDLKQIQDYDQQMLLAISSGNAPDLFFSASWANNFARNASSGNLHALDNLLPQYAPTLWKSLNEQVWRGVKVDGKLYGIINEQRFPKLWGFTVQQKLADKYNIDLDKITSYEELEPYLAKIKQHEPDLIPWYTDNKGAGGLLYPELEGWDPVNSYGAGIKFDDGSLSVFNRYDTDEYRAAIKLARKWHEAGYSATTPASPGDATAKWTAGQFAFQAGQFAPTNPQIYPFATTGKSLVKHPVITTDSISSALLAINQATKSPETVLSFVEQLHTDKELFNLLCFGIEGKHWVYTDKELDVVGLPAGQQPSASKWNPNMDWQFGSQFNAHYRTKADAEAKRWEVERKLNESSAQSKALGFTFDSTKLQTQVATTSATLSEYLPQLQAGLVPYPQGYDAMMSKLKASGADKLIDEAGTQLSAWKKANA